MTPAAQITLLDVGPRPERPVLWHYTPEDHARAIMNSGTIQPMPWSDHGPEPAIWFSANPIIERTACGTPVFPYERREGRDVLVPGSYVRFRLDVTPDDLVRFESAFRREGRLGHPVMLAIVAESGRMLGADPSQWWVTWQHVPVATCTAEVWSDEGWGPWTPRRRRTR